MKKAAKKVLSLFLVLVFAFGVAGCGVDSEGGNGPEEDLFVKRREISIEDINVTIKSDLFRNQKVTAFEYVNNTDYTLSNVNVMYKLKSDTIIEDIRNLGEPFNTATADEFCILGSCPTLTKAGETSAVSKFITDEKSYFDSKNVFNYMEPDYIQIQYLKDGYIHETRYEYSTGDYIDSSETKQAHQWSDCSLAKMIPEPKSEIVQVDSEFDDLFDASFKEDSLETYDSYLAACKNAGFVLDSIDSSAGYEAKNESGYEIDLQIYKTKNQISIMLFAP